MSSKVMTALVTPSQRGNHREVVTNLLTSLQRPRTDYYFTTLLLLYHCFNYYFTPALLRNEVRQPCAPRQYHPRPRHFHPDLLYNCNTTLPLHLRLLYNFTATLLLLYYYFTTTLLRPEVPGINHEHLASNGKAMFTPIYFTTLQLYNFTTVQLYHFTTLHFSPTSTLQRYYYFTTNLLPLYYYSITYRGACRQP